MSLFTLETTDGAARAGTLRTRHGPVPTPAFMPVASQGSVKALDPADLQAVGATIVLANAYHLYLRPGVDSVRSLGGLHRFMSWPGPILTDSGGFQGFSLQHLRRVTDDAIVFTSHIDGSLHTFTPEAAVRHQEALGADIIMPLDVCVPSEGDRSEVEKAVELTGRWAERSLAARSRNDQALFGIVQGGLIRELRERSVGQITGMGFPGYSIGGLSVGESKPRLYEVARYTAAMLPEASPRYLMGVGSPEDLVESVAAGVDLFDCALPTRVARNGSLYLPGGRVNIASARFKDREDPIQGGCDCYTCDHFSAAYLRHLFRARELLAYRLCTIHNLRFVLRLMEEMRAAVVNGDFAAYRDAFLERYVPTDEDVRTQQRQKWLQARRRARDRCDPGQPQ